MPKKLDDLRSEKRKTGRHSILVCYPSQDGSEKSIKHACKTEDISIGGLKIIIGRPLPLGCILPIEVQVTDLNECFDFNGEVKWCLEINEAPTYFAGIKLLKISKNDYQKWCEIANE
jgi:hypothetical protein